MAEVSVVVAICNVEAFLPKCIESLRRQDHHDVEFILVDDGSTDRSTDLAVAAAEQDPRFSYTRQDNRGMTQSLRPQSFVGSLLQASAKSTSDSLVRVAVEKLALEEAIEEDPHILGDGCGVCLEFLFDPAFQRILSHGRFQNLPDSGRDRVQRVVLPGSQVKEHSTILPCEILKHDIGASLDEGVFGHSVSSRPCSERSKAILVQDGWKDSTTPLGKH